MKSNLKLFMDRLPRRGAEGARRRKLDEGESDERRGHRHRVRGLRSARYDVALYDVASWPRYTSASAA
jgi:hypothetical protein